MRHVNHIKEFLFSQGVSGYQPLRRDQRQRLETFIPVGEYWQTTAYGSIAVNPAEQKLTSLFRTPS